PPSPRARCPGRRPMGPRRAGSGSHARPALVAVAVRRDGLVAALDGCPEDPRADLAAVAAGQPAVDDGCDAMLDDAERVDRRRRPPEPEVRDAVLRMLADGDVVHAPVHLHHRLGGPALVGLQPERRGLGEPTEPDRLVVVALAADP